MRIQRFAPPQLVLQLLLLSALGSALCPMLNVTLRKPEPSSKISPYVVGVFNLDPDTACNKYPVWLMKSQHHGVTYMYFIPSLTTGIPSQWRV